MLSIIQSNENNSTKLITDGPLTATKPWSGVSENYRFISTERVLDIALANGFEVQKVSIAKVKRQDKQGFQKHRVDLVHRDFRSTDSGSIPRLSIINGHDRSAALTFALGLFRLVCANGLLVGDIAGGNMFKVYHMGAHDLEKRIHERIVASIDALPKTLELMRRLQGTVMTFEQIQEFQALVSAEIQRKSGIVAIQQDALIAARRSDDVGSDAWRVFNRVQENVIKGNYRYQTETNKIRSARVVKSIDSDVQLNQMMYKALAQTLNLEKAA